MAEVIFTFDLRTQPKKIIVQDNLDYGLMGWDINDVVAIVTFTGPQAIVYNNEDFNSPDIVPATSLFLNKTIPLPLDPETNYENAVQGNYTLKVSWYNSVLDETHVFLDTYQYIFDLPTIANTTVSGPYSGTLTSTDTTDYGNNIFSTSREHRIIYPTQLAGPPPDIVSSDAVIVVTPIYTNKWTIQITSTIEYHNPDELRIIWEGTGEFYECVYGSCINSMAAVIDIMLRGYYDDPASQNYNQEAYQKRLVTLNTAWHLLNIAYQEGDVDEADKQSYVIQAAVEWTGSGTCGGATSELVISCPPYAGGLTPPGDVDLYVFENGIHKIVEATIPKVKLGGALLENTSIVTGEYSLGISGSYSGRTVSQTIDTVNGVRAKASDTNTEGRIYVAAEKLTLELADLITPANTVGYELLSTGIVEKADYTAGYVDRNLVAKSYVDDNFLLSADGSFNAYTEKVSPIGADILLLEDSADGFKKKKVAVSNFTGATSFLGLSDTINDYSGLANEALVINGTEDGVESLDLTQTYIHTGTAGQINGVTNKATPVGADVILIEDSADSFNKKEITLASIPVTSSSFLGLTDTPSDYTGFGGYLLQVKGAEDGVEFVISSGWVPVTGGEFTGQVKFSTSNDRPIILKQVGSGGTPGIPEAGINYVAFQDGDGDEQGVMGVDASGNIYMKTNVSGGKVYSDGDFNVNGNITLSGTVDGRDVAVDGTTQDAHIADTSIHFTKASISHTEIADIGTNTHAQIDTHIGLVDNPHGTTLELARTAGNIYAGNVDYNDNSIVNINGLGFKDGQTITWSATDYTLNIPTGLGPILQTGQETYVIIYNGTGSQINNARAIYPIGAFGGRPSVALANATTHVTILGQVLVTTMDIPDGQFGIASMFGKVRDVDTSIWNLGDTLWVSSTTDGAITNVKPEFPNYAIQVGGVSVEDAVNGEISLSVMGRLSDTVINFWNGVFRESFDFMVDSNGTVITGSLEPSNGHDDMTMMFSDGLTMLDTSPAATIVLTAGTDTNPQTNYVYIPKSSKVLTVSTSDWPTTVEHIKVATIVLRTAAATQTDGALRNQNWNDHIEDTNDFQGHLSHITERIRQDASKWHAGVEPSVVIDTGATPDDVFVKVTAGVVYQLHRQNFPILNMQTGDDIHAINHFTTPYLTATNLNVFDEDATGSSLSNSSFSFVVWGIANKTGQESHLMLNLPVGKYGKNDPDSAVSDPSNFSVYTIPKQYEGTGFLIARFTFTLDVAGNIWTLYDTEDLRGRLPNISAGGGGGGTVATTFLGLIDTPSSYSGQGSRVVTVNVAETALEFTEVVTSVAMTVPAGLTVSGTPITNTGTLAVAYDTGYSIPTTAKQANWDTAFGWGDHATQGYLTEVVETDLNFTDITTGNSTTSLHGLFPKLSNVATQVINGVGSWVEATSILDPFAALTSNSSVSWDTSGGLNKTWSINNSYTLTLTNFSSGMSGDVKVTVTAGTPTITLTASGVTFTGNGSLAALANGIYHLAWVCTSATTIEWNIALYA